MKKPTDFYLYRVSMQDDGSHTEDIEIHFECDAHAIAYFHRLDWQYNEPIKHLHAIFPDGTSEIIAEYEED